MKLITATTTSLITTTANHLHFLTRTTATFTNPEGASDGPPRSDATMSPAAKAHRLSMLTLGWTLAIVGTVIFIGVTIFCVVGKRRCGLRPRERDFAAFDAPIGGNGSSIPRAEEFDTRTDAEIRDERRWREREEREFGRGMVAAAADGVEMKRMEAK
ncbi:uncharacterized protein HMPREF1541_00867 [Cyphellophora europaea CBS 101466]|uniref:Transmembrane protein n=1 Tax=Cyphellophora europaea (strain CBS 101466) TaxID=1220924 RepID=W2SDH5_CYPE1|nr:uncharacterized protein HMPREF1541_00867 [Cyphellophora europaea CBS 101466]ETN46680.1 hypothetical protein HMPREF1541_00867 [Cyphellophora europaea CBS 101466]